MGCPRKLLTAKEPYLSADTSTPPRVSFGVFKGLKVARHLLFGRLIVTEYTMPLHAQNFLGRSTAQDAQFSRS
jgi:hypothetical protein